MLQTKRKQENSQQKRMISKGENKNCKAVKLSLKNGTKVSMIRWKIALKNARRHLRQRSGNIRRKYSGFVILWIFNPDLSEPLSN